VPPRARRNKKFFYQKRENLSTGVTIIVWQSFGGTGFQPVPAQAQACGYIFPVILLMSAKILPNLTGILGGFYRHNL
jgi:hypothetical protein